MIIEAAITIASLFVQPAPVAPTVTCHAGSVSYKFVGESGTTFSYSGRQYSVPASGSIELVGHGEGSSYQIAGKRLPLDVWPIDGFGTRTVPLPSTHAGASTSSVIESSVN